MNFAPRRQTELSWRSLFNARTSASLHHPRVAAPAEERREHRRHDLEQQGIAVERYDGPRQAGNDRFLGRLVDISAGGVRIRTSSPNVRPDAQIRVRLQLPTYCGISPFIDTASDHPAPKQEWIGWVAVCRVTPVGDGSFEIGARLLDMEDMDRGMLGLYLSTQPLAA